MNQSVDLFCGVMVTDDNLDEIVYRLAVPDIGCELTAGCFVRVVGERTIALWPNGLAAVCYGGDSVWGDYIPSDNPMVPHEIALKTSDDIVVVDGNGDAIDGSFDREDDGPPSL